MMKFTILVIASVLAPGFAAIVQTRPEIQISTFPDFILPEVAPEVVQLPGQITPELRPLPIPVPEVPVLRPMPVPEVEAVVPEIISINPCDACFEYMSTLIGQLTEVAVPEQEPEVPETGLPAPDVPRPLPESVPEDLRPLPTPEESEVEINPIPIPVVPETDVRPVPLPVAPEVEVVPMPQPAHTLPFYFN